MTADEFVKQLTLHQSDAERQKIRRYFRLDDPDNQVIGVRMKVTFDLAKAQKDMPLDEVAKLLAEPSYEARMGAVSILDFKARSKKLTDEDRAALYDLYISRHDRINSWDFVDRSAPRVVGGYLVDKPRDVLYQLARSEHIWERRTAIVATWYFVMRGDLDDAIAIAEILLHDEEELINKPVGTTLRHIGQQDREPLLAFLDKHATAMPRATLRIATEKLDKAQRDHYLGR